MGVYDPLDCKTTIAGCSMLDRYTILISGKTLFNFLCQVILVIKLSWVIPLSLSQNEKPKGYHTINNRSKME